MKTKKIPPQRQQSTSGRNKIYFAKGGQSLKVIESRQNLWEWPEIQRLFNEVLPLTDISITKSPNIDIERLTQIAHKLYPFLPDGKKELKTIIEQAKRYHGMGRIGKKDTKAYLAPYLMALHALLTSARQKLSVVICRPNYRNWDLRAYRLFLELQQNLGRFPRLHFVTLTIAGEVSYRVFRERIKKLKRKLNDREFEMLPVVSYHPRRNNDGRLHAHLVIWSLKQRTAKRETADLAKIRKEIESAGILCGNPNWETVRKRASYLRQFAYMAYNYSQTIKLRTGINSPIPKGARMISPPKHRRNGEAWVRVGRIDMVTPARRAWRQAIAAYAEAHGKNPRQDRRWIWRERRKIREFMDPESWSSVSITGLDGYTYRVILDRPDAQGNETYRLCAYGVCRTLHLTHHGLEEMAKLQVMPGTLTKNENLDPTTGETAFCYEMLGMHAFDNSENVRRGRRRHG